VLKMAVAYPLQHRFRAGLVMFMFGLVIFSLVVASVVAASFGGERLDLARSAAGFDAWGPVSRSNPIEHIEARIAGNPILRARLAAVGGIGELRVDLREPQGGAGVWSTRFEAGIASDGYLVGTRMPLRQRAKGMTSDAQTWNLLRTHPGYALVSSSFLATKQTSPGDFVLRGVRDDGHSFTPVRLQMRDRSSGTAIPLTVIGVLDDRNVTTLVGYDLYTGQKTLSASHVAVPPIDTYFFRAPPGQDVHRLVLALGTAFLANGLDLTEARIQWGQLSAAVTGFGNLLEGFMALGLLVGIAALGVIALRSVVERRQQIGMLRALGFTRAMVLKSFLLESALIACLGTTLGTTLGVLLARQVVQYFAQTSRGLGLIVPWTQIALIVLVATIASLLTTYLPARQAASIAPAEALRYE
jgi:putative ABC transport system permease protein